MEDPEVRVAFISSDKEEPIATGNKEKITRTSKKEIRRNNQLLIGILGSCGVIAWIVFFSIGMLIDSSQFRNSLSTNFTLFNFIMTMFTFTPSNIAILCLISSFTGGCASLLMITKAQKALGLEEKADHNKTSSQIYMSENPFSSLLRGIVVFFAFLAGVFVTSSNALSAPTAQAYTQAAGIVSMLAFLVGYDPTMFRSLINVAEKMKSGSD